MRHTRETDPPPLPTASLARGSPANNPPCPPSLCPPGSLFSLLAHTPSQQLARTQQRGNFEKTNPRAPTRDRAPVNVRSTQQGRAVSHATVVLTPRDRANSKDRPEVGGKRCRGEDGACSSLITAADNPITPVFRRIRYLSLATSPHCAGIFVLERYKDNIDVPAPEVL